MDGGDEGGKDTETDAYEGDVCAIEEDADEEAEGDDGAGEEGLEWGTGVEGDEGSEDGEGEDHAASDLVERCVDVFEGVIAEAVTMFFVGKYEWWLVVMNMKIQTLDQSRSKRP